MDSKAVPQDGNETLGGQRKAVYARDEHGRMVVVPSKGWEVEEIVTTQAVTGFREQAEAALARVKNGRASPLEYWMYAKRMDVPLLAQASGVWRWRVRRHLQAAHFARLNIELLQRYADALGLNVDELRQVP